MNGEYDNLVVKKNSQVEVIASSGVFISESVKKIVADIAYDINACQVVTDIVLTKQFVTIYQVSSISNVNRKESVGHLHYYTGSVDH